MFSERFFCLQYYAFKYERIAKRRCKKRAIIDITRMILIVVFAILSNLDEWRHIALYKVDMSEHLKEKKLTRDVKQATRFLET